MKSEIIVGIISSVLTAIIIFVGAQALGLFQRIIDQEAAQRVAEALMRDPVMSELLITRVAERVEGDLPDWEALISRAEVEDRLGRLSFDTYYLGKDDDDIQVRAHDDCGSGYTYIGPNRPYNHGGFCVRIVSQ